MHAECGVCRNQRTALWSEFSISTFIYFFGSNLQVIRLTQNRALTHKTPYCPLLLYFFFEKKN